MKMTIEKTRHLFLRVMTPVFSGWGNVRGELRPIYAYEYAVSYARSSNRPYGDSFWIVPGTIGLNEVNR